MYRLRVLVSTVVVLLGAQFVSFPEQSSAVVALGDVQEFLGRRGKLVLTFVGYSSAGYEDEGKLLDAARDVLAAYPPNKTIVNIGATPDGIGQIYAVAKRMGFETTGIVSTQAREVQAEISPRVDSVFYIEDDVWGGFVAGTDVLSPTSQAMVECSDVIVGIGGGEVARDELLAARRAGKTIRFIPADKDHRRAIEQARRRGEPAPTDFHGTAHETFGDVQP